MLFIQKVNICCFFDLAYNVDCMKKIKNPKNILTIIVIIVAVIVVWHSSHNDSAVTSMNNSVIGTNVLAPAFSVSVFQNATTEKDPLKKAVLAQGGMMEQALLHDDYATFVKFTYPKVIELVGGEQKMITLMKSSNTDSKVVDIVMGDPADILHVGSELQTTVPTRITIQITNPTKHGTLVAYSTLVAVSSDQGVNWTFIDTSGKNITTLTKTLPDISGNLFIPPIPKPMFTPN